jgi:hypothetical protein
MCRMSPSGGRVRCGPDGEIFTAGTNVCYLRSCRPDLLDVRLSAFDPKLKPSVPHRSALRKKGPCRKPFLGSFPTDRAITSSMTSLRKFEYRGSPVQASGGV